MNARVRRIAWLALTFAVIATGCYLLASSDTYGTVARNSLLLERVDDDVDWPPAEPPSSFRMETREAPSGLRDAAATALAGLPPGDDVGRALALARFIGDNPRRGRPIRRDTLTTWQEVSGNGRGYCADYSQLFLAFAHAAGLGVREWGFGNGNFGSGHAFNEIWSRDLHKWVFIDAFQSFYVQDAGNAEPLSVQEFQQRLLAGNAADTTRVVPIAAEQFDLETAERALAYYAKGADYMYLFLGNNVFSYDRDPVVARVAQVSRSLEILAALATGAQPRIQILPTPHNGEAVGALHAWRALLVGASLMLAVLGLALIRQLLPVRRRATLFKA